MAGTFERQKTRTKQTTQVRPLFGRDLKIVLSPDKTISNIQLNIPADDAEDLGELKSILVMQSFFI